jgi:hypothetical protein
MVDWYRTMSDMARGDDGPVIGEISITSRMLKSIAAVLLLACIFQLARLLSGSVAWVGVEERNVRTAPAWMHTQVSTNLLSDGFGVSLPIVALKGQEIVIQYRLSSAEQNFQAPHAWAMVTCLCAVQNYGHFRIEKPGNGEIAMPVRETGLYTVKLSQSAGPKGEASAGVYYWGVRSGE